MKDFSHLKTAISLLPGQPGVYKYRDESNIIIYVGKAKNLKKRVSSYFNKEHDNRKTNVLVSKIREIEYTVVDSEYDALLLENLLIKELQPRYNINLKDDKSYPYIKITKEAFPKVSVVRNPIKDGSEYIGPYANIKMMQTVLDLALKIYPIRNCNLALNEKSIADGKFNVCLEYQIGNCKGPCKGFQSKTEYQQSIDQIKNILKGQLSVVKKQIKSKIDEAAKQLAFEEAHQYKVQLDWLENYQSKSTVVSQTINNVDVFAVASNDYSAWINYLRVKDGMIIQSQNIEIKRKNNETDHDLLLSAIAQFKNTNPTENEEFIVPFKLNLETTFTVTIPLAGDKKKLLDLSFKNAMMLKQERQLSAEKLDPDLRVDRVLNTMKSDLRLSTLPKHIECFDNSNIQGAFPVSACVVFKNAKPSKSDYRHFNIKTVEGPNDFASMQEVLYRRYKRLIEENTPLPDLIVVDGGKGQLSSAVETLKKLDIYKQVAVIGIAKKLEEIYYPGDSVPMYLDKKSETLKIIQQMRDEAHRFGITHHRNRRSKNFTVSELTQIEGIGSKTSELLLKHYKSIKKIREASLEDLASLTGKKTASLIVNYFNDEN